MKAVIYQQYGTPEVLQFAEVEKPLPKENEVLIKVKAASINSWDWDLIRGKPYIVRVWGLTKPKYKIPGADISGVVESIGSKVKRFKPGDEVFGDLCECGWGGFAEYASVPENALAVKPKVLSFENAAALPQAGVMAMQGIYDQRQLAPDQKVLINGAGGGVGTIAVQLAKLEGAEITAVDKAVKLDMLSSLGAHHVMDYESEDYIKAGKRYDLIIDMVADRRVSDYKKVLSPGGVYSMIGGKGASIINVMLFGSILSKAGNKKVGILAHKPNLYLTELAQLVVDKKIMPVIDSVYPLQETQKAFKHFKEGMFKGKVIIKIE